MSTEIDNLLANATNIYVGVDGVARKVVKAYKGVSGVADLVYSAAPASLSYLTFSSDSSFTLNVYDNTKHWDGTLYYSTDTTNWSVWNGTSALSSVDNKLYLRGTGNTIIAGNSDTYRWVLTGTAIECTGNIETLLDWETVELGNHPTMADYCYYSMFLDCTSLTTAPTLPAMTLADYCYSSMFQGCTSLTPAPALPATTMANYCYSDMFLACYSLTTAPALPATTMANYCYFDMFYGCTALTTAPALPAIILAERCYSNMFRGCTALTTAPALPATTLANYCYHFMFLGCTALTTAPALPATTMANYCYYYMFQGCTAFKVSETQTGSYQHAWRMPTSGTGTTAGSWNSSMLANTGGTFTSSPVINATYYVENLPV